MGEPYHHTPRAGNRGDLVKHAALMAVVTRLHPGAPRFRYAESHAGPPLHPLVAGGEWEEGIGELLRRLPPRTVAGERGGVLDPYLEGVVPAVERGFYPGSAAQVWSRVGGGEGAAMALWDRQGWVCRELAAHFGPGPAVVVHEGEGLAGVAGVEPPPSLVLVDPVALEPQPLRLALTRLLGRGVPFLCWTPRRGTATGVEAGTERAFREWARAGGMGVAAVRWGGWRETTCGCQLTTSPVLAPLVGRVTGEVAQLMGWEGFPADP